MKNHDNDQSEVKEGSVARICVSGMRVELESFSKRYDCILCGMQN